MQSNITLGFGANGRAVLPNRVINSTTDNPDFTDLFGVADVIAVGTAIYQGYQGNWKTALAALAPTFTRVFSGKDVVASKTGRIMVPHDGHMGGDAPVQELRVVFRAWSEDTLTESIGRVDQNADLADPQIEHMGDRTFSQGSDNYFVSRWRFDVQTIIPGEYSFNFMSGDDGWLFDVGVSNILTVQVLPGPPDQPLTHQPLTHGNAAIIR